MTLYLTVCYCSSLRGSEGFMMERYDLVSIVSRGAVDEDIPHMVVPLLGHFKGETGERCHLFMMVNETKSGIQI